MEQAEIGPVLAQRKLAGVEGAVKAAGRCTGECAERRGCSRPQGRAAEADALGAAPDTRSKEGERARELGDSPPARRASKACTRACRLCNSARNSKQKEARRSLMQHTTGRNTKVALAGDGTAQPGTQQPEKVQGRPQEKFKEQADGNRRPTQRTCHRDRQVQAGHTAQMARRISARCVIDACGDAPRDVHIRGEMGAARPLYCQMASRDVDLHANSHPPFVFNIAGPRAV